MNKYLVMNDNIVVEIIPEYTDIFPGVPANQRYSAEFLSRCIAVDENIQVEVGQMYNGTTGEITTPPVIEIQEPEAPPPNMMEVFDEKIRNLEIANTKLAEENTLLTGCVMDLADVVFAQA